MKVLILVPQAGFGNRIRAVASGVVLAQRLGRKFYLCWPSIRPFDSRANVAEMQRVGWEGLFEESFPTADRKSFPKLDRVYSEWLPGDGWYPVQNYVQREWGVTPHQRIDTDGEILKDCQAEIVVVETGHAVRLNDPDWGEEISSVYHKYFMPKKIYLDQLGDKRYNIGISIRKGDLTKYFSEANQSDQELRTWVQGLAKSHTLMIFSDDQKAQKEFREIAGIPNHSIDPFLQFLTLALRCDIVCGTPKSSFAEQAALFGGVPYYTNLSTILTETASGGYITGPDSNFEATLSYRKTLKEIISVSGIRSVVELGCGNWNFFHEEFDGVKYSGFDCVKKVIDLNIGNFGQTENRSFIHQKTSVDDLTLPRCDLLLVKDVLQSLSFETIAKILTKARESAGYILMTNDYHVERLNTDTKDGVYRPLNPLAFPFNMFPCRPIQVCNGKMMVLIPGRDRTFTDFKYSSFHDLPSTKTVLVAILARNKAHTLPKYLECIEHLNYDKEKITIYVNTNNNSDRTEAILQEWIQKHEGEYAKIIYESGDVQELGDDKSTPHGWNDTRCSILGRIRDRSLKVALECKCDYYFVIDCDNFITNPYTLKELIAQEKPIIAPMLRCHPHSSVYANYWYQADSRWFYKGHPHYNKIMNWSWQSNHRVPVVHCTYLIRSEVIPLLSYTRDWEEGLNNYEFGIFCRSAVKNGVDQYICNKSFYGSLYLPPGDITLEREAADFARYVKTIC